MTIELGVNSKIQLIDSTSVTWSAKKLNNCVIQISAIAKLDPCTTLLAGTNFNVEAAQVTYKNSICSAIALLQAQINAISGSNGTVTSVSVNNLSPLFTASVATATTTPVISFAQISQNQNLFFASPNGAAGVPTFRSIVNTDLGSGANGSKFLRDDMTWQTVSVTIAEPATQVVYGTGASVDSDPAFTFDSTNGIMSTGTTWVLVNNNVSTFTEIQNSGATYFLVTQQVTFPAIISPYVAFGDVDAVAFGTKFILEDSLKTFSLTAEATILERNFSGASQILKFVADGTDFLGLRAPAAIAASVTWTLPIADSTGTQALVSNGAGTLSWSSFGTGTVTSVSVVTANGISGSVATATTTPAITLTLGAITPTSVNGITFSGSGSLANTGVSSLTAFTGSGTSSGTNTGDQTFAITIGTTAITSGTLNRVLFHSAAGDTVAESASMTFDGTTFATNTITASTSIITAVSNASTQVKATSGSSVATTTFRTTNGGANVTPFIHIGSSAITAGATSMGWDATNLITIFAGNGTRNIARASIQIINLTNTAGSEAADFSILTQSAGTAISSKFVITSVGNIYGLLIHNNATSPTGATNGYIASGTYTPTLTGVTNVSASTAYVCQWIRVGNVVTVSGKVDIDVTLAASTATELGISLPIASALTAEEQLGGTATSDSVASLSARIKADAANDRASLVFKAISLSNDSYSFIFQYLVL